MRAAQGPKASQQPTPETPKRKAQWRSTRVHDTDGNIYQRSANGVLEQTLVPRDFVCSRWEVGGNILE